MMDSGTLNLPLHCYIWNVIKNTTRAERISCAIALIFIIVCLVLLIVYFLVIAKNTGPDDLGSDVWNISREMWLARDYNNTEELPKKFAPTRIVIINHSVSGECFTVNACSAALRNLQNRNYDLAYNFVIGNDGRVYEGRGWNKVGAHAYGYNFCSVGIGFIGDYRLTKVTNLQLDRAKKILELGVELGYLDRDYYVIGAKDLKTSESPGTNLYNAIQTWKHYDHTRCFQYMNCAQITALDFLYAPREWNITRELWNAQPFSSADLPQEFEPVRLVIVNHSATSSCSTYIECAGRIRDIQQFFISSNYDIPYQFLIGNDGRVYEGRGWGKEGAHSYGYNKCSLGVGFIGDFREEIANHSKVTETMMKRFLMLLDYGVKAGYLHKDYYIVGGKDLMTDWESPGSNLYKALKKLPNFNKSHQFKHMNCSQITNLAPS